MNKEELEELYSIAFEDKSIQSEAIKEHIKKQEQEIDRLNNIIEELEKWCNECIDNRIIAREHGYTTISDTFFEIVLDKIKALKENK